MYPYSVAEIQYVAWILSEYFHELKGVSGFLELCWLPFI